MSSTMDIVERLQQPVMLHSNPEQTNAERREAAAEIGRLRAENQKLKRAIDFCSGSCRY